MMRHTIFVGIDPGQTGAISAIEPGGALIAVVDMPVLAGEPDPLEVYATLEALGRPEQLFVALEEPFANPRGSSQSQMTQGIGYGILLGVVGSMSLRHERIRPADWKKELHLPMSTKLTHAQKKANSRQKASQLWPEHADKWAKANQDGRAEALLIAECLRRRAGNPAEV